MTHDAIIAFAVFGVAGQVLIAACALAGGASLAGFGGPWRMVRGALWGYELWAAFVVSAVATGGSLFFSEIANFVPCELCWYQRICMYPLSIITLLAALAGDYRVARYLLPLPAVGACVAVYHLLIENGVVGQSSACFVSAPGGCATKWINEFGYMTIPTLTLTGFVILLGLLGFAAAGTDTAGTATVDVDA